MNIMQSHVLENMPVPSSRDLELGNLYVKTLNIFPRNMVLFLKNILFYLSNYVYLFVTKVCILNFEVLPICLLIREVFNRHIFVIRFLLMGNWKSQLVKVKCQVVYFMYTIYCTKKGNERDYIVKRNMF